jgi:cell division protein FtsW (lipid II flippase)
MIFAVIAEEFGFVGAAVVILLLAALVIKIFMNSITADRMSGALICAGVAGMLTYQIIENIGMCLGMLPVIGITLPFLSYGGSSILGNYLAIGMVLSVYAKNDRFYFSKGKI